MVSDWIGRSVRIVEGIEGTIGEEGIVLAVDDTHYRPSAWVKVHPDLDSPAYRSCDLCWLQDLKTGEYGPVWGSEESPPMTTQSDPVEAAEAMSAALDAINASGIAWVAPWEATAAMRRAARSTHTVAQEFAALRDAHLAEQADP